MTYSTYMVRYRRVSFSRNCTAVPSSIFSLWVPHISCKNCRVSLKAINLTIDFYSSMVNLLYLLFYRYSQVKPALYWVWIGWRKGTPWVMVG